MDINQSEDQGSQAGGASYETDKNSHAVLILILLAVVLVVGAYFLVKSASNNEGPVDDETAVVDDSSQSADNVTVTHTDVNNATTDEERLPAGFPRDIPVETTEINESYTAAYGDDGMTQHSFSYRSQASVDEKFSEYEAFMNEAGYTIENSNTESERIASITGTKDGDTLSVVVSQQPENTMVQLSYLSSSASE